MNREIGDSPSSFPARQNLKPNEGLIKLDAHGSQKWRLEADRRMAAIYPYSVGDRAPGIAERVLNAEMDHHFDGEEPSYRYGY